MFFLNSDKGNPKNKIHLTELVSVRLDKCIDRL